MKRFAACCFPIRPSKSHSDYSTPQGLRETMEKPAIVNVNDKEKPAINNDNNNVESEILKEKMNTEMDNSATQDVTLNQEVSEPKNIILNHDFSEGLHMWQSNCCKAYVISADSGSHAVVTDRQECWQGLEQDITDRVSAGSTYSISARVRVSGEIIGCFEFIASLRLENHGSATTYVNIARNVVSVDTWETLEDTFSLSTKPDRVVFYLEGHLPGVDLLVKSVRICCVGSREKMEKPAINNDNTNVESEVLKEIMNTEIGNSATQDVTPKNIILNHDFSEGLHMWHSNCCKAHVVPADSGSSHAVVTDRQECWQGLEQDITDRVSAGPTYSISARAGVSGKIYGCTDVIATLSLEKHGSDTTYVDIARSVVSVDSWETLEGTFSLSEKPDRVMFYLQGPPPGVNILVKSVRICCAELGHASAGEEDVILNPAFEDGLNNWTGRGSKLVLHDSMADGKIVPLSGKVFACSTERTQTWHGIQQEITGRAQRKLAYEATATVRIYGNNVSTAEVRITLYLQSADLREQYIGVAKVQATDKDWVTLQGKFLINGSPSKVVVFLEGPPPATDLLINSFSVKHAAKVPPSPPPVIEDPAFGVNIIANSNLNDGTNGWFPLGNCTMSTATGSPHILPPMARDSLGAHVPLSGKYILVTNRTQTWMGPAQMVSDKVKPYLTYQVSAWVKIGSTATGPQMVNVALSVDGQWVNGGQVEISDDRWHEIGGAFRIEKQAGKVMVYLQGPAIGVDFMVAGFQIFAVDRKVRFKHLKRETDKIRKRDVVLKFSESASGSGSVFGTFVRVRQTQNSFPFGSCINRSQIDNEDFTSFFIKNFNWAVFGNELKWYSTEPQQGKLNYKDADELLDLCTKNNIPVRGHCIFWEVESTVQPWIRSLSKPDMTAAVQTRLTSLLTRYKGKFPHYDVNNEMLHGSFYQDHLGKEIRAYMFKTAHQLDPSAILFVNDYHVEDYSDTRSYPEKYIQHVLDLQGQGAPVGGLGIQGHIDNPIGSVVCSALDKIGILGLPVWFTEVDVSSANEYVRADDLEVMLRECFAHPAVEGIMLWGFWELFMSRVNSHLVNAEGDLNEAGKRFLALKQEWVTHSHGHIDEQGQFCFRGFHGSYEVEVITASKKISKTFVVDKGDDPLVINIDF